MFYALCPSTKLFKRLSCKLAIGSGRVDLTRFNKIVIQATAQMAADKQAVVVVVVVVVVVAVAAAAVAVAVAVAVVVVVVVVVEIFYLQHNIS